MFAIFLAMPIQALAALLSLYARRHNGPSQTAVQKLVDLLSKDPLSPQNIEDPLGDSLFIWFFFGFCCRCKVGPARTFFFEVVHWNNSSVLSSLETFCLPISLDHFDISNSSRNARDQRREEHSSIYGGTLRHELF